MPIIRNRKTQKETLGEKFVRSVTQEHKFKKLSLCSRDLSY